MKIMKWFHNMRISAKLLLGFGIVAVIAGVVGIIAIINIKSITEADRMLYQENTLGIYDAGYAGMNFQKLRLFTFQLLYDAGEGKQEQHISNINSCSDTVDDFLKKYEKRVDLNQEKDLFNSLKYQWDSYKSTTESIVKHVRNGDIEKAESGFLLSTLSANRLQSEFELLFEYNSSRGRKKSEQNTRLAQEAAFLMIVVLIAGVVLAAFLGIIISRAISKPIAKMVDAADKLALGDVNVVINADGKDEVGRLASSFDKMIDNIRSQAHTAERLAAGDLTVDVDIKSENDLLGIKLSEMIRNIKEAMENISHAAEQVATGAKQVFQSSKALSEGAAEQASSVEQLTASLEEISSQTNLNAQNADEANKISETAMNYAVQGNNQMKEMLSAMDEINESSSNISKIIKVIDEIAFQTNILALNAAVEAARAGEHGKGFAVVAEEVRNLASRSANAAKETTDMIENSIEKAKAGTIIAKETALALEKIVEGVKKASTLVSDIAVASNEQDLAISQINQGVMQVSEVVQENSATSEESAAASEELSNQAELLRKTVSNFKLKKSESEDDYINPEILKILEENPDGPGSEPEGDEADVPQPSAESISDTEFAKY